MVATDFFVRKGYTDSTVQLGGAAVRVYLDLVVLLNFLVDLLLLAGTDRLLGIPPAWKRLALAAALGSLYAAMCMLPGLRFMGNTLWRIVSLGTMAVTAFGWSKSALRRCMVFVLLSMALGGVAMCIGTGSFMGLVAGAGLLFLLCALGFRGTLGSREFVSVELRHGVRQVQILALRDTGNGLTDPVTGQSVLVVDPVVADRLLGLTRQQLQSPVETVASGAYPGLRLIPYRSVGQPNGLLPAMRLEDVRIDKWQGSTLVAFAPAGLDAEGTYQALMGGVA